MMKKFLIIICFVSVIIVVIYMGFSFSLSNRDEVILDRCVDGDTAIFKVHGKRTRVRFLGIDTPESVKPNVEVQEYSIDASKYACQMLEKANHIYLEYDGNSDRYDKYDRLLAWVFVDDDNLSELLVLNGYAMVRYIYDDYKYVDSLCMAQEKAYLSKLGIWSNDLLNYSSNYCNKRGY